MLEVSRDYTVTFLQDAVTARFNTFTLHLFKNNWTPSPDDDVSDYTSANFSGYSSAALNSWGGAALNADLFAQVTHPDKVFTHNGGATNNDIYGYYVTDSSGDLVWAERAAAAPFAMDAGGKTYTVSPEMLLFNQSEA